MDRIRIAVVGLNFGKVKVRGLLTGPEKEKFEIVTICDKDPGLLAGMAQETGLKTCSSLDELLADSSIRAIGLFTNPSGRAALIRKIIHAGRHVMTTKPFELDPVAGLEVLKEARRLGLAVHMNSPSPLWPEDLALVRAWVQEYDLGKPVACRMNVWARKREKADGRWLDDPRLCPVAPVFRIGIYLINDMVRLLGEAEKVQVFSSRLCNSRPTPDNAQLGILFRNGAIGNVFASFCVEDGDPHQNGMALHFERGTIYRNDGPYRHGSPEGRGRELALVMGTAATGRKVVAEKTLSEGGSGAYQWDAFYDAIQGKTLEEEVTPEQVVAGLRVMEAMIEADRTGGTAAVKPVIG